MTDHFIIVIVFSVRKFLNSIQGGEFSRRILINSPAVKQQEF